MNPDFSERKEIWHGFLKENWTTLRELAREAYAERDRGAFLVELKSNPSADKPLKGQLSYLDERKGRELFESWYLSRFLDRIDDYNPLRSILILWWDGEDAQPEVMSEHEDGTFRDPPGTSIWDKRERPCPKCNTVFRSVQNRGGCPQCGFLFFASDFYGKGEVNKPGPPIPPIVELHLDDSIPENFEQLDRQRKRLRSVNPSSQREENDELIELVFEADYQINNGGFQQFFDNTGSRTKAIVDALTKIGATENARVILEACQVFPNQMPSQDPDELDEQIEQVQESAQARWDRLSQDYFRVKVDLGSLLFDYWKFLRSH